MFEVREQIVEQARKFFPNIVIFVGALDPFKFVLGVTKGDGPEESTSNASNLFLFCLYYLFSIMFPRILYHGFNYI